MCLSRGTLDRCTVKQLVKYGFNHFLYWSNSQEEMGMANFLLTKQCRYKPCGKLSPRSRSLPELCTDVSQGEVEGVGGHSWRPSGRLDPNHSSHVRLRVHGEVTADLLHALTRFVQDEAVWNATVRENTSITAHSSPSVVCQGDKMTLNDAVVKWSNSFSKRVTLSSLTLLYHFWD